MSQPVGRAAADRPSPIRVWLLAARPATLPAALSGVVVGLGAAAGERRAIRLDTALGCVAVALLLQVVANFANDLSDFRRGADTPERNGPVRVAAAGLVTERQLEVAIAIAVGLAGLVGLWLAYVGGPVLLVLGAARGGRRPRLHRRPVAVRLPRRWARCSCSCSSGWWRSSARRTCRPRRLDPVYFVAAIPVGRADHGDPRRQQPARHPDRRAPPASGRWR